MTSLLRGRVIHLLKNTRNNDHDGRLGDLKIGDQRLDALRDVNMQFAGYANVVDGTCERVRLWKEQQHAVLPLMQQFRHIRRKIQRGGAIMLMGHLHTLRRGGRTRSIHNGAQVGFLDGSDALVKLFVAHAGAVGHDFVETAVLEADNVFQCRAFLIGTIGFGAHIGGLDHQQAGIGIIDDITDLLRGIRVVDRGEHTTTCHDGRVEHIPLVRGTAHERHAVALLKTVMHQTLGDLTNIGEHLVAGFGHPFAVRLIGVERLVTHTLGSIGVNIVDGGALVQRRLALGFGGQQTGFRIEERGGWESFAPFDGVRKVDMAVGGDDVVRIVVIRSVAGIVADGVNEVTSQTQCLLRKICSSLVQRGDDGHVTLLHI